ncbi:glucokinase regulatory protein isoform X2 [Triplophysa dalaica]|uniref:glucokinase regulatory protein isoform X2 n=1 Tax=Triplophysa dalaica TaxID=1582913 RepID=UPI0024DFDE96|nr:glucokinase regulatory protein isoform X2 [Triplophysa dalaica]
MCAARLSVCCHKIRFRNTSPDAAVINMDHTRSCFELSLPFTEKCNPISRDIDRADAKHMLQILKTCDAEIFTHDDQGIYSSPIIQTMVDVAKKVELMLREPEESLIVLSGCGTSGRIAFLLATSFNEMLTDQQHTQIYSYIIAGGDRALLTSQEASEDRPLLGARMLDEVCAGKKRVLFMGISCGMSAPFVAGQLDLCLKHLDVFTPVLLGFNPVHMARNEPMQDCSFHFKEVAERMATEQKQGKAFILNPIVGPEAISGSSRMKGGSATKIILEAVLLAGHQAIFREKTISPDLQRNGHVYYLGWRTLGIIGMIDASECVPTFGADFGDIRGFINNGFKEMRNKEGDLSSMGPEFVIGHQDFVDTILPVLNQNDMIVFLFTVKDDLHEMTALVNQVKRKTRNLHAVAHDLETLNIPKRMCDMFETVLKMTWSFSSDDEIAEMKQKWELSTKCCLNVLSTGAHVLKGKVYMNFMIDLRVTNSKLYRRAINILQRFSGRSKPECESALLRAIYSTDDVSEEMTSADVRTHTQLANRSDRVVPTALVMIHRGCSLTEAKHHLDSHAVIRDAVMSCVLSPVNTAHMK